MNKILLLLMYLILGLFVVYRLKNRTNKNKFIGAYAGFLIGIILYYVVVPIILIVFADNYISKATDYRYERIIQFFFSTDITDWERIRAIVAVFVGVLGIEFGYVLKRRASVMSYDKNMIQIYNEDFYKTIHKIAWTTLIIGGIFVLIYLSAFGGITNALALAEILRQHYSSISDYGISGIYSYFLIISGMLAMSPILFYYLWKKKQTCESFIMLVISFLFAGIYLLLNSGKSAVLRLAIIFFYMFMYERKIKHKIVVFLLVIIIGLPLMDVLDAIFAQKSIIETLQNYSYLYNLREFAIPTELTVNMGKITSRYGYMYFSHLVTDFLDLLPGVSFSSSFANTSEFMKGVNWINLGGTPNDLITYGFLQFQEIGIFIICMIWGYISGWIDNILEKVKDQTGRTLLAMTICMNMVSVITCADISSTILYNLSFVLTLFILWKYIKRTSHRK